MKDRENISKSAVEDLPDGKESQLKDNNNYKPSKTGIKAMQGPTDPGELASNNDLLASKKTCFDLESIKEMELSPEDESLLNSIPYHNEGTPQKALAAAEKNFADHNNIGYRRHVTEGASLVAAGNKAVNLDAYTEAHGLHHQGNNYPLLDLTSNSEVASVKTHFNNEGKPDLNQYNNDFWSLLQADSRDGKNILEAAEKDAPVPEKLRGLDPSNSQDIKRATNYIKSESNYRIPDNHVDQVRAFVLKKARDFPENYGLPESPSDKRINRLLERIQPCGLTSYQIEKYYSLQKL